MKFQKPTKKQLLKALIPALWIGFFLFVVIHMAITSSAAGGAGTYKFTIAANPFTDEQIGTNANYLISQNSFKTPAMSTHVDWYKAVGGSYSYTASSSSSIVFTFCNWIGTNVNYAFIGSDGYSDLIVTAKGGAYGEFVYTYVYASDLPSTGTYTVVPTSMGGMPYRVFSNGLTGSISFLASLPDGSMMDLGTVTAQNFTGGAMEVSTATYPSIFGPRDGYGPLEGMNAFSYYICDNTSRTIIIPFVSIEQYRTLTYTYMDANGTTLGTRSIKISEYSETVNVRPYLDYAVLPTRYTTTTGTEDLSIIVYVYKAVDEQAIYEAGYKDGKRDGLDEGFDQGLENGLAHSSVNKQQAYDKGYADGLQQGLSQNALTGQQMSELRTDYNAVTGFFDGMWSWMKDLFNTVTEGVAFGGVTVGNIIWTVVIIVVVLFLAGLVI